VKLIIPEDVESFKPDELLSFASNSENPEAKRVAAGKNAILYYMWQIPARNPNQDIVAIYLDERLPKKTRAFARKMIPSQGVFAFNLFVVAHNLLSKASQEDSPHAKIYDNALDKAFAICLKEGGLFNTLRGVNLLGVPANVKTFMLSEYTSKLERAAKTPLEKIAKAAQKGRTNSLSPINQKKLEQISRLADDLSIIVSLSNEQNSVFYNINIQGSDKAKKLVEELRSVINAISEVVRAKPAREIIRAHKHATTNKGGKPQFLLPSVRLPVK